MAKGKKWRYYKGLDYADVKKMKSAELKSMMKDIDGEIWTRKRQSAKGKTWKYYRGLDYADVKKMKSAELKSMMKDINEKIRTRKRQFGVESSKKYGAYTYSFALERYETAISSYKGKKNLTLPEMRHKLKAFIRFSNAVTSTVTGARKWAKEQDKRIFGGGKEAKYRMSREERERFWNIYNEYLKTHEATVSRLTSDTVQRIISEIAYREYADYKYDEIDYDEFDRLISRVYDSNYEEEEDEYNGKEWWRNSKAGNVFSGDWDDDE